MEGTGQVYGGSLGALTSDNPILILLTGIEGGVGGRKVGECIEGLVLAQEESALHE